MRSRMPTAAIALVVCAALIGRAFGATGAVTLAVTPAAGLYDQARTVVVSHLRPHELVTISAGTVGDGGTWQATATYEADAAGRVDLARAAPRSGSYTGAAATGLIWSAKELATNQAPLTDPTVATLTVDRGSTPLASAKLVLALLGHGVTQRPTSVAGAGFLGEFFAPPGHGRHPAVVVWGGSEGGIRTGERWAALLASHGIPALGIAYFDEPGLPCKLQSIPLEYFVKAIRWLRAQPDVDPGKVWLLSGSRGSEAELLVADHFSHLVHGLIAEAPSSIGYAAVSDTPSCPVTHHGDAPAWTLGGKPVPFDDDVDFSDGKRNPNGTVSYVDAFKRGLDKPAARAAAIPLSKVTGPVLLLSGGDDQLWPSKTYADMIMAALPRRGDHRHLNYAAAGHNVFDYPNIPPIVVAAASPPIDLGGTIETNEAAHEAAWPAAISFLEHH